MPGSKKRLLSLLLVLAVAVSMFSVRVTAESGYAYADKTDKPHGDRQNAPNTGEKDGFFLWSVILVISGGMAVSLSEKSGRRTKRTH